MSGLYASITKVFRFEAAHQLPNHKGKCRNLHGHSYKLEVTVFGMVSGDKGASHEGMVMDFSDLSDIVKREIINKMDHQFLNDVIIEDYHPTTAENLVHSIGETLGGLLPPAIHQLVVRLWETETGYAEASWTYR